MGRAAGVREEYEDGMHAHKLSAMALAALIASVTIGIAVGCGPNQSVGWICLNPVTHKEDGSVYDATHYVGGEPDPCHCYDPCGPSESCPIVVDAGPPGPDCSTPDAGDGGG
jgi:hypothetical protein